MKNDTNTLNLLLILLIGFALFEIIILKDFSTGMLSILVAIFVFAHLYGGRKPHAGTSASVLLFVAS